MFFFRIRTTCLVEFHDTYSRICKSQVGCIVRTFLDENSMHSSRFQKAGVSKSCRSQTVRNKQHRKESPAVVWKSFAGKNLYQKEWLPSSTGDFIFISHNRNPW
mmetsp:Transcript_10686/g.24930  ORF Transcript_10686/g.24930 Transcript_10686/m.24930 type:complete len:104 (+) Transcript_10686:1463-1774(+)